VAPAARPATSPTPCGGAAGIVIGYPDVNVMTGIVVANRLYGTFCPMFLADEEQRTAFATGMRATIGEGGEVTFC